MRISVFSFFLIWSLATFSQIPDYIPTDGLVGWWPFNGNANDESGSGNDGMVFGATLTSDRYDLNNNAYFFNGSDFIQGANNISGTSTLSISIWVKLINNNGGHFVHLGIDQVGCPCNGIGIGYGGGQSNVPGTQLLALAAGVSWLSSGFNFNALNTWQHILINKTSPDSISFYVNGQFVNSSPLSVNSASNTYFFGAASPNYALFQGILDDIGIWNRALTEEEIQQLYLAEVAEGCTDLAACNYNPDAGIDDGSCEYAPDFYNCQGICLSDTDGDGFCDELETYGCTYAFACNYNPLATQDDGSCTIAETHYDCEGNCLLDLNGNGLCDLEELVGCTSPEAINYQVSATLDDGSCQYTCAGDINGNGNIDTNDLLIFLASYGNSCSGSGCMDPEGCNYDPEATFDLGYCQYPAEYYNCEGSPINDADGDGIPDELEVPGCMDPNAANYDPLATEEDGSCQYSVQEEEHSCGASSVHNAALNYGSVADVDGNTYKTIVIGNQEWMAENLNTSHYANGDEIPNITGDIQWEVQTQGAWCYYNNDEQYACPYGKLYNWFTTVDARNVCPTGWHVPSDAEWTALKDYLGGDEVAGGKMKSIALEYWDYFENIGATNESGFSGFATLNRTDFGGFGFQNGGNWWSFTEYNNDFASIIRLLAWNDNLYSSNDEKENGFSIRCLRD
jgi:uncharacterized protein (TIGR02145 family)